MKRLLMSFVVLCFCLSVQPFHYKAVAKSSLVDTCSKCLLSHPNDPWVCKAACSTLKINR